jgi:hypothetical protein
MRQYWPTIELIGNETLERARARFTADDWSGRGDSNPRLELGKLPYYPYTTAAFRYQKTYNMLHMMPQAAKARGFVALAGYFRGLTYLHDPRRLHHGRSFLPARKTCGLGAIRVNARKFLPVCIIDRDLPMAVFSTPVFAKRCLLFSFLQGLSSLTPENISSSSRRRKY